MDNARQTDDDHTVIAMAHMTLLVRCAKTIRFKKSDTNLHSVVSFCSNSFNGFEKSIVPLNISTNVTLCRITN
jgi:hypothetical protein